MTDGRLASTYVEAATQETPAARLAAEYVEAAVGGPVDARLAAEYVEVASADPAHGRLATTYVEVLEAIPPPPTVLTSTYVEVAERVPLGIPVNLTASCVIPQAQSRQVTIAWDVQYYEPPTNLADPSAVWQSFPSDQHEEVSTALFRSAPSSVRFYSSAGSQNYGVQRLRIPLEQGKTYRIGYYMRAAQVFPNHRTYLEVQAWPSSIQYLLAGPVPVTTTGWTLLQGDFAVPVNSDTSYDMLVQSYKDVSPELYETFVDDWFVYEVPS